MGSAHLHRDGIAGTMPAPERPMYESWTYDDETNESLTAASFPPLTSDEVEVHFTLAADHRDAYEHAVLALAAKFVSEPQLAALDLLRANATAIAAAIPDAARAYTRDWPWDVEARAERHRRAARSMEVARAEALGGKPPPETKPKPVFEDFTIERVDVGVPTVDLLPTIRLRGSCAWDREHGLLVEVVDGRLTRLQGQR